MRPFIDEVRSLSAVILSGAKDLCTLTQPSTKILRFAQNDSQCSPEGLALLQRSRRNVLPIVRALKADLRTHLIGAVDCFFQLGRPRRDSQHAPARSIKSSFP